MTIRWLGYGFYLFSSACVLDMSPESNAPVLEPKTHSIVIEGELQFSVAPPAPVAWSVSEPTGGAISQEGIYSAPDVPGTYHVIASNDFGSDSATLTVVDAFVSQLRSRGFVPITLAAAANRVAIIGETTSGDTLVAVFEPTTKSFNAVAISSLSGLSIRGAAANENTLLLVGTTVEGPKHPMLLALGWNAAVAWATEITNATGQLISASISSAGDIFAAGRAATDGASERPLVMMVRSTGTPIWARLGDCDDCLVSASREMGAYRIVGGNKDSTNWLAAFQADGTLAWSAELKDIGNLYALKTPMSGERLVLGGSTDAPIPWIGILNSNHDNLTVIKVNTPLPLIFGDIAVTPLSTIVFAISEGSPWLGAVAANGELAWQQVLDTPVGGTTIASGEILGANLFGLGTYGPAEPMFFKLPTSGVPNLGMQSNWIAKTTDFQVTSDEVPVSKATYFSFQPFAIQTRAVEVKQATADFAFAK